MNLLPLLVLAAAVRAQEVAADIPVKNSNTVPPVFSADGSYYLVSEQDAKSVKAFALPAGTLAGEFKCKKEVVNGFDLSPDGKVLAYGCEGRMRLVSFPDGAEIADVKTKGSPGGARFIRGGQALAFVAAKEFGVLEAPKWKKAWSEAFSGEVAFAPDGSQMAGLEFYGESRVFRSSRLTADGKKTMGMDSKTYEVEPLCLRLGGFSSDSKYILYTSENSHVCVFDAADGSQAKWEEAAVQDKAYAQAPGGRLFVFGKDSRLKLRTLPDLKEELSISPPIKVQAVAASPKGKYLFAAGYREKGFDIFVFRLPGGKLVKTLEYPMEGSYPSITLTVSPDGRWLSAWPSWGAHRLWKLDGGVDTSKLSSAIEAGAGSGADYKRRGMAQYAANELEKAAADLVESYKRSPKDGETALLLGDIYLELSRYKESQAAYSSALKLDGPSAKAHVGRGFARFYAADLDGAAADFSEASRLEPGDGGPAHLRGVVRFNQGRLDEALADQKKALAADPRMAPAHFYVGLIAQAKGDVKAAITAYETAILSDPKDARLHYYLGRLKLENGDPRGAEKHLEESYRLAPDADNCFAKALAGLKARGEWGYGLSEADERGHPVAPYLLGVESMKAGMFTQAIGQFKRAIHRNPDNAAYPKLLAEAQRADRDERQATAAATVARNADNNYAAMMGSSLVNAARGIAAGVNTSGSSGGGSYAVGTRYSAGSGGGSGYDASAAMGALHAQTLESQRRDLERSNRQFIEKKLWNMNNPHR